MIEKEAQYYLARRGATGPGEGEVKP